MHADISTQHRTHRTRPGVTAIIAAVAATLVLAGCQGGDELAEIQKQQQEILAKLDAIEKGQKQLASARPAARPQRPQEDFNKVYELDVSNAPILGNPDAPVTLVEYSDFQCPFCARAAPLVKALLDKYPDDLKVAYMHFPLSFHQAAKPTAIASMAAQEQGKFWEFHDVLFENVRSLDAGKIEEYATKAGLDVDRFKQDMQKNAQAYNQRVESDMRIAQTAEVRGTPTLYINGRKVQNRTVEGMSAMVEAALKESIF
jgi:protein-disulfide isomerase